MLKIIEQFMRNDELLIFKAFQNYIILDSLACLPHNSKSLGNSRSTGDLKIWLYLGQGVEPRD